MPAHRSAKIQGLPRRLTNLIQAAEFRKGDWEGRDITGVASALREFGLLARWVLPIHGVFVPNDNEVSVIIRKVAKDHLGLTAAAKAFREAVEVVAAFDDRDRIESAQNHIQSVSDEAHFYAGLAFGLALADDC